MLDVPTSTTPFRKSFDKWWNAQTHDFQQRTDVRAACTIFQSGYTAGHKKDVHRYIYKAHRFRITVWANSVAEAKKAAISEAKLRASAKGWKAPPGGWPLERLA
jgi:hypothetical protein